MYVGLPAKTQVDVTREWCIERRIATDGYSLSEAKYPNIREYVEALEEQRLWIRRKSDATNSTL